MEAFKMDGTGEDSPNQNNGEVVDKVEQTEQTEQTEQIKQSEVTGQNESVEQVEKVELVEQTEKVGEVEKVDDVKVEENESKEASSKGNNSAEDNSNAIKPVEPVGGLTSADVAAPEPKKKKAGPIVAAVIAVVVLAGAGVASWMIFGNKDKVSQNDEGGAEEDESEVASVNFLQYSIKGNSLEDFDLAFLKLENEAKNKLYSPLSIKYALGMLEEGANGETKEQISKVIGTYTPRKYPNNENMSFANAVFINSSVTNPIKDSYVTNLKTTFDAEVIRDSFKTPDNVNNWISDKTLGLVKNMIGNDISLSRFLLVNALAIDMEWQKKIQPTFVDHDPKWSVSFPHIAYGRAVSVINADYAHELEFLNSSKKVQSLEIAAVANKYDILKDLGEEKMRATIREEYDKWLDEEDEFYEKEKKEKIAKGEEITWFYERPNNHDEVVDQHMKELGNGGYGTLSSSTDFSFYVDDDVKVFAKDLKEYEGTTLQYVAIMPKKVILTKYIKNLEAGKVAGLIDKLKPIQMDSFKEGVITDVYGYIPIFKYDYDLNLIDDLKKLGIKDVFDDKKSDLSNLTSEPQAYVEEAKHKANIAFTNYGIKAAAVTVIDVGLGGSGGGFNYQFKVPVEKIDLTFDKPFMYLIRDKETGEVWFTGTVYKPLEVNK